MFERFTSEARTAVVHAQEVARRLSHDRIGPEHLMLAVLEDETGLATRVLTELGLGRDVFERHVASLGIADADALRSIGIDLDAVRQQAESSFGPGALDDSGRTRRRRGILRRRVDHIPFTAPAKKALELSLRHALALGHKHIGTEHLVLAMVHDDGAPVARALLRLGVAPDAVRTRLRAELGRAA